MLTFFLSFKCAELNKCEEFLNTASSCLKEFPQTIPLGLLGDRHQGIYVSLVVVFVKLYQDVKKMKL